MLWGVKVRPTYASVFKEFVKSKLAGIAQVQAEWRNERLCAEEQGRGLDWASAQGDS